MRRSWLLLLVAFAVAVGFRFAFALIEISVEVESGSLTNATTQGDGSASGGSYVQFGSSSQPDACNDGGSYLWDNLELCGWPGPDNTGHPSELTLTETSAREIHVDNTIIDGERITGNTDDGTLVIYASNVIIRNSWITRTSGPNDSGTGVIMIKPGGSATIENTTLDGDFRTHSCVFHAGESMTTTAVNCHHVNDAIFLWEWPNDSGHGNNFTIKDNYFHDLTEQAANGHIDGIQSVGAQNGLIEHNTFRIERAAGDISVPGGGITSAMIIKNDNKTTSDIIVRDNLIAGGGFSIYFQDVSPGNGSPGNPTPVGGNDVVRIEVLDNKFSTYLEGDCIGFFGVWFFRSTWTYQGGPSGNWGANGNIRSGNYVLENGFDLDDGNPAGCI